MNNNNSGGLGLLPVLGVVFVVLKLVGVIGWSWWLVLLPFYLGIGIVLAIFLVMLVVSAATVLFASRR